MPGSTTSNDYGSVPTFYYGLVSIKRPQAAHSMVKNNKIAKSLLLKYF